VFAPPAAQSEKAIYIAKELKQNEAQKYHDVGQPLRNLQKSKYCTMLDSRCEKLGGAHINTALVRYRAISIIDVPEDLQKSQFDDISNVPKLVS